MTKRARASIGEAYACSPAVFVLLVLSACGPHHRAKVTFDTDVRGSCPVITGVTVLPLEVLVGGSVEVNADMTDGAPEWFWSATAGHFDDPDSDTTRYHCDVAGKQLLTFTLRDGPSCEDSVDLNVTCSSKPSSD